MRVLVTGGSGFVGSHAISRLRAAGHDVRALVRTVPRLESALALHGLGRADVEVAPGDMTDAAAVREAVSDCQAVIHSAAVYSYDPRDAVAMLTTNALGTRTVLEAGAEAGADHLVHVSSVVAVTVRHPGTRIVADSPLGNLTSAYATSKRASDEIALRMQREGAALVRCLPGAVVGPLDPAEGETNLSLRNILRSRPPFFSSEAFAYCDVRDCADLLVALAEGRGDRPAWFPPLAEVNAVDVLRSVTGRRLPVLRASSRLAHVSTAPAEWAVARLPRSVPALQRGGIELLAADNHFDDEAAFGVLGVTRSPIYDTFRETVAWMAEAGLITRKQAGAAA